MTTLPCGQAGSEPAGHAPGAVGRTGPPPAASRALRGPDVLELSPLTAALRACPAQPPDPVDWRATGLPMIDEAADMVERLDRVLTA